MATRNCLSGNDRTLCLAWLNKHRENTAHLPHARLAERMSRELGFRVTESNIRHMTPNRRVFINRKVDAPNTRRLARKDEHGDRLAAIEAKIDRLMSEVETLIDLFLNR